MVTVDRVVKKGFMEKVASREGGMWGLVDTGGRPRQGGHAQDLQAQ